MTKPKRVGIYVRISKDRKGLDLGIQRQEKACRELCGRMSWGVLKVYSDSEVSASTTSRRHRPGYTEMLRDIRDGRIDGIVVYSIDRLTRRISELTSFLEEQKKYGFAFATTEGEDTLSANGRLILTIKGAVAQQETERMSERINNSLLQRREQGKPHAGGKRQFGFQEDSRFQELDDRESTLIREGYHMLVGQASGTPGDVARYWNSQGARTPQGGDWTIQSVKRVFRSERTGGIVTYKGQDIGDSIYKSPLTRDEWEDVQTLLNSRATPAAQGSGKRKHLYSGFLRCGYCGANMRVQWATVQGRTFRRTFCHSGQPGRGGRLGCGKVSRQYQWIEERLNEVVQTALRNHIPRLEESPAEDFTGEINLLESRIQNLRKRWKQGEMDDDDYFDSLAHLRINLQDLRTRETSSLIRRSRIEQDALSIWMNESPENLERRRAVAATVVEHVDVLSVGRGRRKPPEDTSIRIVLVNAAHDGPSEQPVSNSYTANNSRRSG
ncbi:hypothetical protein SRB5_35740 [Streptomyces sp. RB5]|uniref:Uncharacterized protein n=1 Tax=Streptomyces smaragdinus TaxID=2585196 RepID=A0A7K0CJ01_9ACTN|nr:recombinase family protein [Streptomyces smaragdinus]MQY13426.1 hypothetical protein [Streptomyces smaragdinus]